MVKTVQKTFVTLLEQCAVFGFITEILGGNMPFDTICRTISGILEWWSFMLYSWVPNRRVYSFIWHPRNMKKETDTKTDKSI